MRAGLAVDIALRGAGRVTTIDGVAQASDSKEVWSFGHGEISVSEERMPGLVVKVYGETGVEQRVVQTAGHRDRVLRNNVVSADLDRTAALDPGRMATAC